MPEFKNEVHISGELSKDPAIKYTGNGNAVANLTLITKHKQFKEFHRITLWKELAEKVAELRAGAFVRVVGRLQTRSWTEADSGQRKYITEVVGFNVSIPADDPPPLTPDRSKQSRGTATAKAILEPITDEDIPF
jgi:single-strand DNA-binding protein